MNMLDKLFSREIKRRTGAHAIDICIDTDTTSRERSHAVGAKTLKASSGTRVIAKKTKGSFLHRLDVKFPFIKLLIVLLVGIVMIADLCDLTISKVKDPHNKVKVAPMSKHIRVTERVLEGKKLVVLTFDDGPSSITTPRLLDILSEKDVHATFFILGRMTGGNLDIIKRMEKEGHVVASHTMHHQNLTRLPTTAVQSDIDEVKSIIASTIGHEPVYVRPPYGLVNDNVRMAANKPLILWSVDTEDWHSKNPEAIISTTMSEVYDGSVILMHDIYPTTVDAVPALIDTLRKEGYEFTTIEEVSKIRGIELTPGAIYYDFCP